MIKFIESEGIKFYCEQCEEYRPGITTEMTSDNLNRRKPWTDILCKKCKLVLASIEADQPGICHIKLMPKEREGK